MHNPQSPDSATRWLALAVILLRLAAAAPPAAAQEMVTAEPETEPAGDPEIRDEDEEYDDELLEPSDTGYIDDAVVRSRVRIRYDSMLDADRPDRAEFIYGKCTCFTLAAGQDSASPGPAENLDLRELELSLEKAFGPRLSLFLEVPFRWTRLTVPSGFVPLLGLPSQEVSHDGLGDLRAGVKYGIVARRDRALTFQVRAYLPTGDAARNLGTDHATIEPGILHLARLSDRWTVFSELRWWHPLSGSSDPVSGGRATSPVGRDENAGDPIVRNDGFAGDILRFGLGASLEGRGARVTVSPVVELVGWYVVDGFATPPVPRADRSDPPNFGFIEEAGRDTIVNLKLGARIGAGSAGSIFLGYGFALTDDVHYDDVVRIEYRLPLGARRRTRSPSAVAAAADRSLRQAAAAVPTPATAAVAEPAAAPPPAAPSAASAPSGPPPAPVAAPAVTAPPAATAGDPGTTVEEAVRAAVERWSEAWAARRVDDYLEAYAAAFRPPPGVGRQAWEAGRRRRIEEKRFIRLRLGEIGVTRQGPGRATAEFVQRYESDSYSDTVRKRLVMTLENGAWKILAEDASP